MDTPAATDKTAAAKPKDAVKRDAATARLLPTLYDELAKVTALLDRAKADATGPVVHTVHMNLAGEVLSHMPIDKDAWSELLIKDLETTVAHLKRRISECGFEPG